MGMQSAKLKGSKLSAKLTFGIYRRNLVISALDCLSGYVLSLIRSLTALRSALSAFGQFQKDT
jgi:hypothetical protein